jgi:hypothetical protein
VTDTELIRAAADTAWEKYWNAAGVTTWERFWLSFQVGAEKLIAHGEQRGREAAEAEYKPRLERMRDYTSAGNCRSCGTRHGGTHHMSCRHYVGPLEHKWIKKDWNGTFGGIDHRCTCGGWFRKGGLAGHGDGTEEAEAVCPNAAQDWRGPRPEEEAHG